MKTGVFVSAGDICPVDASESLSVDTAQLAEGAHQFRIVSTDLAGNVGASEPWTVYVDRTSPAFVAGSPGDPDETPEVPFLASDSDSGASLISWPGADDPDLADGNPGSGVDHYLWRYRASSTSDWSAWAPTPDDKTDVQIDVALSHIELQVVPVDQVGNSGSVQDWLIDETPDDDAPVPDYVPDPATIEDDNATVVPDPPSLVEDKSGASDGLSALAVPVTKRYTCDQTWAPIQAVASGFVIGSCSKGTRITSYRRQTFTNFPGAEGEGKVWVAASLPDAASFSGCGWLSVVRLDSGGSGSGNSLCSTYNRPNKSAYMHVARRRPNSVPPANTKKYPKFYIWATTKKVNGKPVEQDGYSAEVTQACTAYANINPWKKNQTASGKIADAYAPGDQVAIRYLSRYRAKNPVNGQLEYWIMTHSGRTGASWLWLPASCRFKLK